MALNDIELGVNIDHVATIRQARATPYPDLRAAALIAEGAGAASITLHLREDRRHIQDTDVTALKRALTTRMNLEMAATGEMVALAANIKPEHCCVVPERREELTTEGGLNVIAQSQHLRTVCARLAGAGIEVSLFIDPESAQIDAAREVGAHTVEFHTGRYAGATNERSAAHELTALQAAAKHAAEQGLQVNAGHGLHYDNVTEVAHIAEVVELNIGHAIVARALFSGLESAVREMKSLMEAARS